MSHAKGPDIPAAHLLEVLRWVFLTREGYFGLGLQAFNTLYQSSSAVISSIKAL